MLARTRYNYLSGQALDGDVKAGDDLTEIMRLLVPRQDYCWGPECTTGLCSHFASSPALGGPFHGCSRDEAVGKAWEKPS